MSGPRTRWADEFTFIIILALIISFIALRT
jgi:hypothetical protein